MEELTQWLRKIQELGLQIHTVYDIGAWQGAWSQYVKYYAVPNAQFVLFEANPAYQNDLAATGFTFFNKLLSNPGRETVEFFNGTNTGDSYYKETTTIYDNQTSITLPCVTLDELVKTHNLPIPNFIKIDTQGSELDILAGAEFVLEHVDLIHIECPIIEYNKGAPNIHEYLEFLKNKNFVPVDIVELQIAENILLQVDMMFMKKDTKDRVLGTNKNIRLSSDKKLSTNGLLR